MGPSRIFSLAVLGSVLFTFTYAPVNADVLTLDTYLQQVSSENKEIQSSRLKSEGALERSQEGTLLLAPTLFSSVQLISDSKQSPFFAYDKSILGSYSLGVAQQTSFGMQAKLSYNLDYYNYVGMPLPIVNPALQGRPAFEFTQALWRNGFGAETRAQQQQLEASALASHHGEKFRKKAVLSRAEVAYWRLVLSRQHVVAQREGLDRAKKILDWSDRRVRLQLADQSDRYQAEAAYKLRELQLQVAVDEETAASRALNLARNSSSDKVPEQLETMTTEKIAGILAPKRSSERDDVKAAEQLRAATVAGAEAARQRDNPTLDLFGQLAFNSKEKAIGDALSESLTTDHPTYVVGIKFTSALDFGTRSDARAGWEKERASAEVAYQQKLFEQDTEWANLTVRLDEAKRRLEIAQSAETIQRSKLDHERERLNRGRTTTHQVLLFEQDYAQAQLTRIQFEGEVLQIVAQMKLFEDTGEAQPQ